MMTRKTGEAERMTVRRLKTEERTMRRAETRARQARQSSLEDPHTDNGECAEKDADASDGVADDAHGRRDLGRD